VFEPCLVTPGSPGTSQLPPWCRHSMPGDSAHTDVEVVRLIGLAVAELKNGLSEASRQVERLEVADNPPATRAAHQRLQWALKQVDKQQAKLQELHKNKFRILIQESGAFWSRSGSPAGFRSQDASGSLDSEAGYSTPDSDTWNDGAGYGPTRSEFDALNLPFPFPSTSEPE
jgi:hypothetical protein